MWNNMSELKIYDSPVHIFLPNMLQFYMQIIRPNDVAFHRLSFAFISETGRTFQALPDQNAFLQLFRISNVIT